jgi:hypothetical protein
MEIDSEIAKCLDKLDRHDLKFLKDTIKNSDLFAEEIQAIKTSPLPTHSHKLPNFANNRYDQIEEEIIIESPEK